MKMNLFLNVLLIVMVLYCLGLISQCSIYTQHDIYCYLNPDLNFLGEYLARKPELVFGFRESFPEGERKIRIRRHSFSREKDKERGGEGCWGNSGTEEYQSGWRGRQMPGCAGSSWILDFALRTVGSNCMVSSKGKE